MIPDNPFRTAFDAVGWSFIGLSRKVKVNEREVRHWYAGKYRAPQRVTDWLQLVAEFLAANPPPEKN